VVLATAAPLSSQISKLTYSGLGCLPNKSSRLVPGGRSAASPTSTTGRPAGGVAGIGPGLPGIRSGRLNLPPHSAERAARTLSRVMSGCFCCNASTVPADGAGTLFWGGYELHLCREAMLPHLEYQRWAVANGLCILTGR
jgi:hypothetical protein